MDDHNFAAMEEAFGGITKDALKKASNEESVLADGKKAVQKEVHSIAVWALRVGAILLGLLVFVRLWHLAGPEACRWLSDADVQSMDKILFSSAFGGVVLSYLKEIMRPLPK